MRNDPIVEEVYRTRESLLARFNGDVIAWLRDLGAQQHQHGERLVTLEELRARQGMDGKATTTIE